MQTLPKPFAVEWVETAPAGSTIYCVLRHVSRSGMFRIIDLFVIVDGDVRYLHSLADDKRMPFTRDACRDGFRVSGAGMDMGFHVVYSIGRAFREDGYHFNMRWL